MMIDFARLNPAEKKTVLATLLNAICEKECGNEAKEVTKHQKCHSASAALRTTDRRTAPPGRA